MWRNLLQEIKTIEAEYGSTLREPVTNGELKRLKQVIEEKFNSVTLPDQYIEFLEVVNGLDFNGLVIYGVDSSLLDNETEEEIYGFIETNEIWYENEWQKRYIFFGDSDTSWYCLDLVTQNYLELDKPSGTLMNTYTNFNDMLEHALDSRVN